MRRTADAVKQKHDLLPGKKIPLGEPVILPNGAHGLRIKWKRGKKDVTETVPLDKIHELIVQQAAKADRQNVSVKSEGGLK